MNPVAAMLKTHATSGSVAWQGEGRGGRGKGVGGRGKKKRQFAVRNKNVMADPSSEIEKSTWRVDCSLLVD